MVTSELGSMASALAELAAAPADLLVRGTVIDEQYQIERVLGHGGMGVVYLARDLRLERDVAVKLARERSDIAFARSSREAVALARLSHPNVVVIHQVGELDGRVYVAMEYVGGATARAWCAQDRSMREIVEMYVAVGDGLAAAHAAGLVHYDFKPDNVLVGDDGRARVADFGLARPTLGHEAAASATVSTHAGTPAYMAPEQYRREDVDARADQFSFCASLWEALHLVRPFASPTPETDAEDLEPQRGQPDRARRVPRHIEVALRRGLAADREARWPTLAALLAELRRDPTRRRRTIALGAAAFGLGGLALAVGLHGAQHEDLCGDGPARIAAVWSPARAAATRAAIAPSGAATWLVELSTSTTASVDAWSARWAEQYGVVCRDTAWSPRLRDTGMQCLAGAKHRLDATIAVLGERGLDARRIEAAIGGLQHPEVCADPAYLAATVAPPEDPAVAATVSAAQGDLARVSILAGVGKLAPAETLLASVDSRTATIAYPPLRAQVHHAAALLARWHGDDATAFPLLHDVYFEARTVGDRVIAAEAASEAALSLLNLSRDAEADEWARLAEVEIEHVPDIIVQAHALRALSTVATSRNDPTHGVSLADRALAIELRSGDGIGTSSSLLARAQAFDRLGKFDLAIADLDTIDRTSAGHALQHASGQAAYERALVLDQQGKYEEAITAARRALEIAELTAGADSDLATTAIGMIGIGLNHAGRLPEALEMLDRSLAIDTQVDGPRSYNVASDRNNRCDLLNRMRRFADAIADGRIALDIWTEVLGKDAQEIGLVKVNISLAMISAKQVDDALAMAAGAIPIFAKQPEHPGYGMALAIRGAAHEARGDNAEARADLEAALEPLHKSRGNDPAWFGWVQLELAKVAFATGRPEEARPLALAARDMFVHDDMRLAEAQQLLARLP